MKTLLGIDYGTGGCKVTALGTDGSFVGEASTEYTTWHDHPGWSEQEPADWWAALRESLRKLAAKGVDLKNVAASRVPQARPPSRPSACRRRACPAPRCGRWRRAP